MKRCFTGLLALGIAVLGAGMPPAYAQPFSRSDLSGLSPYYSLVTEMDGLIGTLDPQRWYPFDIGSIFLLEDSYHKCGKEGRLEAVRRMANQVFAGSLSQLHDFDDLVSDEALTLETSDGSVVTTSERALLRASHDKAVEGAVMYLMGQYTDKQGAPVCEELDKLADRLFDKARFLSGNR